jgi:ATP adenylyltransferase
MKKVFIIFITIIISQFFHLVCMDMHQQALIYAPWRENYINAQKPKNIIYQPCTFCNIISNKNNRENLILHRGKHSVVMLASQPYIDNGIHILIVPHEHKKELCDLSPETYDEENMFTQQLCALFSSDANETYVNSNLGSAAGASIPEHQHRHIIVNNAPNYYNLVEAVQKTKRYIDLPTLYGQLLPRMNSLETVTLPQKQLFTRHKNCYYCSILQKNAQENFIIHRGKHATIMLSHYPTYFGEIDIIPNEHIEALETMPAEAYEEINRLTIEIYPLVLKIINAQDSNIGLISYGNTATRKGHIIQKIVPRKDTWKKTPITRSNHISGDIKKLYKRLLLEWHEAKL